MTGPRLCAECSDPILPVEHRIPAGVGGDRHAECVDTCELCGGTTGLYPWWSWLLDRVAVLCATCYLADRVASPTASIERVPVAARYL